MTRVNVDGKIVKLSQNGGLKALQTKGPRKGKVDVKIVSKKRKKILTIHKSDGRIYIADRKKRQRRHDEKSAKNLENYIV